MADESTTGLETGAQQGQKTQQQIDDEARQDEEARKRQDPANDPRLQAMEAIAQANNQRIEEQLAAEGLSSRVQVGEQGDQAGQTTGDEAGGGEGDDSGTGAPAPSPAPGPSPAPAPRQPRAKAATVDPQLLAQLGEEPLPMEALDSLKLRMRVNGKERVLTIQELRREAQLDGAAHERLEQANSLLREAQTAIARINGTAGAPATAPAPGAQPPVGVDGKPIPAESTTASQDVTAIAKDLVQSLFVGDEEAATATVLKLLGRQTPQQVDTEALAQRIAPAVRQQMSQEEAERQFRSDFKDIVADPNLVNAADRFYEEAAKESPQKPYAELLAEAGERTRQWIQTVSGSKPATPTVNRSTREEKLQAKRHTDNVRGLSRTEGSQEEPIPTASQTIAEMRAARGLG